MIDYILPPPISVLPSDRAVAGITTTVPLEIMLAAGILPLDLNNIFVTDSTASRLVKDAEKNGFPRTCCAWTKGIYGTVKDNGIQRLVTVVQGDCSNTHALAEILEYEGVECIPFAFPFKPATERMRQELANFASALSADWEEVEAWRRKLNRVRKLAHRIDSLTWREGKVHGFENHVWLVSCSDFCADIDRYAEEAVSFLERAALRGPVESHVRLGLVGVPPIVPDIYAFVESKGGHIVYNETQRQFSMPAGGADLAKQYSAYTYPYGINFRLKDIRTETERRELDGIIHYVQSFCYRRIEDRLLRDELSIPVITIEQDMPGVLSGQLKTRLEAFVEILTAKKTGRNIF